MQCQALERGTISMRGANLLILIAVLALPAFSQDSSSTGTACGPEKTQFEVKTDKHGHPKAAADPDKAVVYVFERVWLDADAVPVNLATIRIGIDGRWVGANHGNSYFSFAVDPGSHAVCADWQSSWVRISRPGSSANLASAASLTAEAGRVYYFQADVDERSHHQPMVTIEPLDPAEAKLLIATSAISSSRPK